MRKMSPKQKESIIRSWPVALGIPALTYGTGLAVLAFSFWLGVLICYLGAIWLLVDWLIVSRKEKRETRFGVIVLPLAAAALVSWLAFRPAPFEISTLVLDAIYPAGTTVAGLKWQDNFADVRLVLINKSDTRFSNIDVVLRTDLGIAGIGFLSETSGCRATPYFPGVVTAGATISVLGKDGQPTTSIPIFDPRSAPVYASEYKVSCDMLGAGDKLELVIAVAPGIGGNHRLKPSWVSTDAEYDAYGRSRSIANRACVAFTCPDIAAAVR